MHCARQSCTGRSRKLKEVLLVIRLLYYFQCCGLAARSSFYVIEGLIFLVRLQQDQAHRSHTQVGICKICELSGCSRAGHQGSDCQSEASFFDALENQKNDLPQLVSTERIGKLGW